MKFRLILTLNLNNMENKNLSITDYVAAGVEVKRFSYYTGSGLLICKPSDGERFFLHEDFLGDSSIVWIVCITLDGELWRQNIKSIARVTYVTAVSIS